ncbi:MAG: response regulator, partial [Hyphomonadaceae bacterium]|nr:response regulator [Hyphomonadaceae bacterium]
MGGSISVESEVSQGSVFAFTAPFEIWLGADRRAAVLIGADPDQPLQALRILLVEDSPDNCTLAMAYLEDTPYLIDVAENGAIACEMFIAGNYDLVLMDRQMPVMDGLTATRAIRAWERANERTSTPIIALTASALKGDRETCMAAGCTAFLTKPIKQDVLLLAIREQSVGSLASRLESNERSEASARLSQKLARMVPAYLQNCRLNVVTILDALDRADFATVTRLGHSMRGSGGAYGFQGITDICAALQEASENADDGASRKQLGALSMCLDQAETVVH